MSDKRSSGFAPRRPAGPSGPASSAGERSDPALPAADEAPAAPAGRTSTAPCLPSSAPRPARASRRASVTSAVRQGTRAVLVQLPAEAAAERSADAASAAALAPTARAEPLSAATLPSLMSQLGFGRYQAATMLALAGFPLAEGVAMLTVSSVVRALQTEWGLTHIQTGSLASLCFIGLAIGTYTSGLLADLYGRRCIVLISYAGMALVGCMLCMATGYASMAILSFGNGVFSGLGVAAANTMLVETMPKEARPTLFAAFTLLFTVGELYSTVGMMLWMPDLGDPAGWRAVSVWAALPAIGALGFAVAALQESAHWLIVTGRVAEARVVLGYMARLNGRPEVISRIWPVEQDTMVPIPEPTRPGSPQASFGEIVSKLLGNTDNVVKVSLFGVVCTAGNMATFGMSYFWPVVLRTWVQQDLSPSQELFVLRSAGLPSGFIIMAVMSVPFLGHRLTVGLCGPLGALSLFGVAMAMRVNLVMFLVCGAVALIAGNLLYTVALVFLSESFPTEIRSTAVGLTVAAGRVGSVSAPLLIEHLGQKWFLLAGAIGFLFAVLAILPLRETKGMELNDYTEEHGAERGGATAPHDLLPGATLAFPEELAPHGLQAGAEPGGARANASSAAHEPGPGDMSAACGFFSEGTIGARSELRLLAATCGALPMLVSSFFLSSVGFFSEILRDERLFPFQLLTLFGSMALAALLKWRCCSQRSPFPRLVLGCVVLATVFFVAMLRTRGQVLTFGAILGCASGAVLADGWQFAASLGAPALVWLRIGAGVGAALPVPVVALVGYRPGVELRVRCAFFAFPGAVCLAGAVIFCWYHRQLVRLESLLAASLNTHRGGTMEALYEAQRSMDSTWARSETSILTHWGSMQTQVLVACCSVGVFLEGGAAFFLLGLAPRVGAPYDVQRVYLYKVMGDLIGRLAAHFVWHGEAEAASDGAPEAVDEAAVAGGRGQVGGATGSSGASAAPAPAGLGQRVACLCTIGLWGVIGYLVLAVPLLDGQPPAWLAVEPSVLWGVFAVSLLGSFAALCLETLAPSLAPPAVRLAVGRWMLFAGVLGGAAGLAAAALGGGAAAGRASAALGRAGASAAGAARGPGAPGRPSESEGRGQENPERPGLVRKERAAGQSAQPASALQLSSAESPRRPARFGLPRARRQTSRRESMARTRLEPAARAAGAGRAAE